MVPLKKILFAAAATLLPATALCINAPNIAAKALDEEEHGDILSAYSDYNWAYSNYSSELKYANGDTAEEYQAEMDKLSKKIAELGVKVAEINRTDARNLEARGDFAGAVNDLGSVMSESKGNAQYYFEYAQALYATGEQSAALEYSTKAIETKPDFAQAYALRGAVKLREMRIYDALYIEDRGGMSSFEGGVVIGGPPYKKVPNVTLDGALADLTRAVTLKPGFAEAWDARGLVKYFKGDAKGATADFSAAIKANKGYAVAWCNRAHVELFSGDTKNATADFEKAVALDPKLAAAWAGRAAAKQSAGDLDGALADINKAISLKGDYQPPRLFRAILLLVKGDTAGADPDFKKAGELGPMVNMSNLAIFYDDPALVKQSPGDIDSALAALDDPPAVPAGDARLRAEFARAYLASSDKPHDAMEMWRGCMDFLDKVIALDPGLAEAYRQRGLMRATSYSMPEDDSLLDDQTDPMRDVEKPPAGSPDMLKQAEKRDAALSIADLAKANQLGLKDDVQSLTRLATLKSCDTGDTAGALADINKAIAIAPDKADLYSQRGAIEKAAGDGKASQADIMHSLDLLVSQSGSSVISADAWYNRGREKEARKDYEGALADFTSAIAAGPAHALSYAGRAEVNYRTARMDTVMADLDKSISLDANSSNNASAYYLRATIERDKGNLPAALSDFSKVLPGDHNEMDPLREAALIEHQLKNDANAREDFAKAIDRWLSVPLRAEGWPPGFNDPSGLFGAYMDGMQADLDAASSFKSTVVPGFLNRVVADHISLYNKSLEKRLTGLISLRPGMAALYFLRAHLYFEQRQFPAALADFNKTLALGNAPAQSLDEARLYTWVIRAQSGDEKGATAALQAWLDDPKSATTSDEWHTQIARFLTGKISEEDFLKPANGGDPAAKELRCEAYFFAGTKRLAAGDKPGAAHDFEIAEQLAEDHHIESGGASAELKFLDPQNQ